MCYCYILPTAKAQRRSRYCLLNHLLVVACIRLTGEAVPAVLLWLVVYMFWSINGFDVRSTTKCVVASVTKSTFSATSILDSPSSEKQAEPEHPRCDVTGMWCCECCCICISLAVICCMHQAPSDLIFTMPLVYAGTLSAYPVKESSSSWIASALASLNMHLIDIAHCSLRKSGRKIRKESSSCQRKEKTWNLLLIAKGRLVGSDPCRCSDDPTEVEVQSGFLF